MWGGVFVKRGNISDHFKIVSIDKDPVFDTFHVTVQFYKSPEQNYVFDIDGEVFVNNKDAIGQEIVRQLGE